MFQIIKIEPSYFSKAKSKVKLPKIASAWEDDNIRAISQELRRDILLKEQNLLCAYCEKEIDESRESSNTDHFKTRNLFPEETLNYHNLLISCNSKGKSCSSSKDSQKSSLKQKDDYANIVNPTIENPDDFFDYLTTGEVIPKNDKAGYTIRLFRLDDKSLTESRKEISKALKYIDLSLDEILNIFPDYPSFIKNIYPKLKEEQ